MHATKCHVKVKGHRGASIHVSQNFASRLLQSLVYLIMIVPSSLTGSPWLGQVISPRVLPGNHEVNC